MSSDTQTSTPSTAVKTSDTAAPSLDTKVEKPAAKKTPAKSEVTSKIPSADKIDTLLSVAKPQKPTVQLNALQTFHAETRPVFRIQSPCDGTVKGDAAVIQLYGEGCLECGALVPEYTNPEQEMPRCHFNVGNVYCPAGHIRIEFVGERRRAVSRIMKAKETGDTGRLLKALASLDAFAEAERKEILLEVGIISETEAQG